MRSGNYYDPEYRLTVVQTLGVVRDIEAVPALVALFGRDLPLNSAIARALVTIGDDTDRRALVQMMDNPQSPVKIDAPVVS